MDDLTVTRKEGHAERAGAETEWMGPMTDKTEPEFYAIGPQHEVCRFRNGDYSLRFIDESGDRAHLRYLTGFEIQLLVSGLSAARAELEEARLNEWKREVEAASGTVHIPHFIQDWKDAVVASRREAAACIDALLLANKKLAGELVELRRQLELK